MRSMIRVLFTGVEGVSKGTTKIIATDQYGNTQEALISVIEVTIFSGNVTLEVGETKQLSATVIGPDGNAVNYGWFTDDSNVASIDENGLITANGTGEVNLGVSVPNAGLWWIKVIVVNSYFYPREDALTLFVGQSVDIELFCDKAFTTVTPSNNNPDVARGVHSQSNVGYITIVADAAGSSTFTLTNEHGQTCQIDVTVIGSLEITASRTSVECYTYDFGLSDNGVDFYSNIDYLSLYDGISWEYQVSQDRTNYNWFESGTDETPADMDYYPESYQETDFSFRLVVTVAGVQTPYVSNVVSVHVTTTDVCPECGEEGGVHSEDCSLYWGEEPGEPEDGGECPICHRNDGKHEPDCEDYDGLCPYCGAENWEHVAGSEWAEIHW